MISSQVVRIRQYTFRGTDDTIDNFLVALANQEPYKIVGATPLTVSGVNITTTNNDHEKEIRILVDSSTDNTYSTATTVGRISTILVCVFGLRYVSDDAIAVSDLKTGEIGNIVRCLRANTTLRAVYHDYKGRVVFDVIDSERTIHVIENYVDLIKGKVIDGLINPRPL